LKCGAKLLSSATVAKRLADRSGLGAALLNSCALMDCRPVTMRLLARGIPFMIYTGFAVRD